MKLPKRSKDKSLPPEMGDSMKTNIPHGINQTNRAHPFFIVLRKYAEEEEQEYHEVLVSLGRLIIVSIADIAIMIAAIVFNQIENFYVAIVASTFMSLFTAVNFKYYMRDILSNLVFPKVNKMIFSDDYSGAILNYENIFNMVALVNDNIGEMRSFRSTEKLVLISNAVFFMVHIALVIIYHT